MKLRNIITTYASQGPVSYRTDEAKVDYLHHALVSVKWAKPALIQCCSYDPMDF